MLNSGLSVNRNVEIRHFEAPCFTDFYFKKMKPPTLDCVELVQRPVMFLYPKIYFWQLAPLIKNKNKDLYLVIMAKQIRHKEYFISSNPYRKPEGCFSTNGVLWQEIINDTEEELLPSLQSKFFHTEENADDWFTMFLRQIAILIDSIKMKTCE